MNAMDAAELAKWTASLLTRMNAAQESELGRALAPFDYDVAKAGIRSYYSEVEHDRFLNQPSLMEHIRRQIPREGARERAIAEATASRESQQMSMSAIRLETDRITEELTMLEDARFADLHARALASLHPVVRGWVEKTPPLASPTLMAAMHAILASERREAM